MHPPTHDLSLFYSKIIIKLIPGWKFIYSFNVPFSYVKLRVDFISYVNVCTDNYSELYKNIQPPTTTFEHNYVSTNSYNITKIYYPATKICHLVSNIGGLL